MSRQIKLSRLKMVVLMLAIFGVTFFAYKDALKGGLVWDAGGYLIANPYIESLSWANIKWMFSAFYMYNWHPLTWFSYALDYFIYGEIWGVALTNVLFHCANACLVFIFVLVLTSALYQRMFSFRHRNKEELVAAFFAALLFGVHPQHVESVAWLAERKDVLSLFFILATFIFYIYYVRSEKTNQYYRYYYLASLTSFILALLSKPMAVTVPFLLIIGDFYPLGRLPKKKDDNLKEWWFLVRRLLIEKLPFLLLSFMVMVITIKAQGAAINPLEKFGFQDRVFNSFNSYIVYISKFLFPVNLIPLYDDFPSSSDYYNWVPVIAFVFITFLAIYLCFKRRRCYWIAAWLFYLISLLPVIGLVKVGAQSSADRYTYLPTIPFYILIGCGFSMLIFRLKFIFNKILILLGTIILVIVLTIMTQSQVIVWKNELYLWNYIVKIEPDHGQANTGLGGVYFNQGDYENAIKYYRNAGKSGGILVYAFAPWAIAYLKLGRLAEAMLVYKQVLEKNIDIGIPKSCIYYNIGLIYARQGMFGYAKQSLQLVGLDSAEEFYKARMLLSDIDSNQLVLGNGELKAFSSYQYCEKYRVYTARDVYSGG